MSPDWRWRDAERSVADLRDHPADRRHLFLLARLPLAPPRLISRLDGAAGGASAYRSLARLATAGLIAARRVPLRPGSSPRLLYLTDLGLAVVALDQGIDGRDLARRNRLRTADLLALLPGLPCLLACYELLGILASSRSGRPDLLAWERPWRRRHQLDGTNRSVSASLPAYAALSWDQGQGAFLLVPDLGAFPVRLYRATLRRLLILRQHLACMLPPIVVATTGIERADLWRELLGDVARDCRQCPIHARLVAWETALADLADSWPNAEQNNDELSALAALHSRRAPKRYASGRCVPRQVQDEVFVLPQGEDAKLGIAAVRLGPEDHRLLDLIGHHPFLPLGAVARVLDWTSNQARDHLRHLIELRLAHLVEPREVNLGDDRVELTELTRDGLRLLASWKGLPLAQAVREEGLAGGGPTDPIGSRRKLLSTIQHTLGVDAIFVALVASARRRGGTIVDWKNAAECSRSRIRPDGYGLYCEDGESHGFFLEYDRGTMGERALLAKFSAYYDYRDTDRFRRDYVGFPSILVVAEDNAAEERVVRAARRAGVGRSPPLSLRVTARWRYAVGSMNKIGVLGPIWREVSADLTCRCTWPRPTAINGDKPKARLGLSRSAATRCRGSYCWDGSPDRTSLPESTQ